MQSHSLISSLVLSLLMVMMMTCSLLECVNANAKAYWERRENEITVICKLSRRPFNQENYNRMNDVLDQVLRSNDMKIAKTLILNFPLAISYTFDDMSEAVMAKNLFLEQDGIEEILLKKDARGEGQLEMFPGKDYDENVDKSGDADFSKNKKKYNLHCTRGPKKGYNCVLKWKK